MWDLTLDATEEGTAVAELLDGAPTRYVGRPRYEGVDTRAQIGFKHVMYLVEEAVLRYFRDRGLGARSLYDRFGLGLEIVDSSVELPVAVEGEEEVQVTVVSATPRPGHGAPFTVELTVERDGAPVTVLKGAIRVALVAVEGGVGEEPVPATLEPYTASDVAGLARPAMAALRVCGSRKVADVLAPGDSGKLLWSWRAPDHSSYFSGRSQHSAYGRTLEEAVNRFLDARGLAVSDLLGERGWLPVVSQAQVELHAGVRTEETVYTVFQVEEILEDSMCGARMACYVRRGDRLQRTATGTLTYGFTVSRGERAGTVATLDEATRAALLGGTA